MTDFIFNVDLSTTYVILRRDFSTPQDETGYLSAPVGAAFYYDAGLANAAARAHCLREAREAREDLEGLDGLMSGEPAVHFEREGMYVGGCVTREEGRDRFEVRVSRLRARGAWGRGGGGGGEGVEGEGRGAGGGLAVVSEEGEEREGDGGRPVTPLVRGAATAGSKIGRLFSRKKSRGG